MVSSAAHHVSIFICNVYSTWITEKTVAGEKKWKEGFLLNNIQILIKSKTHTKKGGKSNNGRGNSIFYCKKKLALDTRANLFKFVVSHFVLFPSNRI